MNSYMKNYFLERIMKKHSRIISILLAMMMVMTSLSIAFALDEPAEGTQGNDPAVTGETPSGQETGEDPEGDENDEGNNSVINDLVEGLERPSVTVIVNYVDELDKKIVNPVTKEPVDPVTQEVEFVKNADGVYEGSYSIESPKVPGYAPDKKVVEGTVNRDSESPTVITVKYTPSPADPVKNFKLHPAYNCIILTWDTVEDAKSYVIQRSTTKSGYYTDIATVQNTDGNQITYWDRTANGIDSSKHTARTYYYKVLSVSVTDIRSPQPATASNTCVRPMYEKLVFKWAEDGNELTSHDGKNKTIYFGTGTEVTAMGFNGGKYEFWYNGYYFTASFIRFKNQRADYQPNDSNAVGSATSYSGRWGRQNYASASGVGDNYQGIRFYDKISAESFVNATGKTSRTRYLIWVSTFTQHLYVFQGTKGNWKLIKDWECSTGAPQSPTPSGTDKEIWQQPSNSDYNRKPNPSIDWWSKFQTDNSIHGQLSHYEFGAPQSNGCVRNYDENAKWIYYNCDVGTGVIIY